MARVLVKKKMAKAIRDATSTGDPSESDDLAPGHMVRPSIYLAR
jgi:hypothetical protein